MLYQMVPINGSGFVGTVDIQPDPDGAALIFTDQNGQTCTAILNAFGSTVVIGDHVDGDDVEELGDIRFLLPYLGAPARLPVAVR